MTTHLLHTSRDGDSTTALGSLLRCLTVLSGRKFSLTSNLHLCLAQLEAVSSHPITCRLRKETDTLLTATFFQVVVESDEPQHPLLQVKQLQFPQSLLITLPVPSSSSYLFMSHGASVILLIHLPGQTAEGSYLLMLQYNSDIVKVGWEEL